MNLRLLRHLAPVAVTAIAFPFLAGGDCLGLCDYETDPNCEDPERAQVVGKITVPEAGNNAFGLSNIDPNLAKAVRQAVRAAAPQLSNAQQSMPTLYGPRKPHQSKRNEVPKAKTAVQRFRAGEIVVRATEPMRDRKAEFAAAIEGYLRDKFSDDVKVDVRLCGTEYRCLADVTNRAGKKLDLNDTAEAVNVLVHAPFIMFAERNLILQMTAQPNDEFFTLQWHYAAIDLPTAWDITVGDPDRVAAVVDTGILYDHPDLVDRVVGHGADLIDDPGVANDGDGRDDDGFDAGDNECGQGCNSFHGSHCAGTIGASTDNGTMVAGVSWAGGLLPVRVLGDGGGSLSDIADGIEWAVGNSVDGVSNNTTPADVMNMSLGGQGESDIMNEAVQDAVDAGCIVLVAAGNDNIDATNSTPANAPAAIVVAAHGNTGPGRATAAKASYSNFGNKVDIAAPGGEQAEDVDNDGQGDGVLSTVDDFVTYYQGTSMATPHVTGVSLLLKSLDPNLNQDDVRRILRDSASTDLECPDGCGAGRMSAAAALLLETQGNLDGPQVIASPSFLRVGKGQTETPVVFKDIGTDPTDVSLAVGGANRDACSIDTQGGNIDAKGQLVATVTITRNEAADDEGECTVTAGFGNASSEARVVWSADAITPLTEVTVGPVQVAADGSLKVIVDRLATASELTGFDYKLFNLDPGTYIIIGLVDTDNNGSFDDPVDAVGIFLPPSEGDNACLTSAGADGRARISGACGEVTLSAGQTVKNADFIVAPGFTEPGGDTGGTGDGVLGDGCASSNDCGGGLFCESTLPDGYCTADCSQDTDCPASGVCASLQAATGEVFDVCLKPCVVDGDCNRTGYICDVDSTCFPG